MTGSTSWVGRNRAWLLIIAGLLVATFVTAWVSGGGAHTGSLDPQNPDPDGAQALAQVLGDQGVDVVIARGADALEDQDLDGATVLVTSADQLGRSTTRRLAARAKGADLVVVEPGPDLIALLGFRSFPVPVEPDGPVSAQCANTMLTGLEVEVDVADSYPPVPAGCFPTEDGFLYAPQSDQLAFLGAGAALSNDQITRADNAALALRLLGQHDRLVWYVPDLSDARAGDEIGIGALLPKWLRPALWLGGLVLLALVVWRGRRLGPLVTEPLPVVVKAIETTQSRGRLYRKVRDRGYAASALRSAARTRAADRLRLPRHLDEQQIIQDVARHSGRSVDDITALLSSHGPTPASDQDLSTLAGHLADLDEQLEKGTPMSEIDNTLSPGHEVRDRLVAVRREVAKAVVGQDAAVSGLLVALLCGGHVLMEGVPGVAKTLLVRSLAGALSVDTRRVQFTPDLMPGDITGSMVIDSHAGELSFRKGPVFTNLLLADEINRTPPKTQSALLEAMEEGQVSVDGDSRPVPQPFLVAATQNPVEYEGTYPLPEAQLDRFLLKVVLPVPDRASELEILRRHADGFDPRDVAAAGVSAVASASDILAGQQAVRGVQVAPEVAGYIVDIARATRESPSLNLGVSPRGSTALLRAARAWAWLNGRDFVTPDDVKALAHATLVHRLGLRPEAELEGVEVSQVLASALGSVPVPR